MSHSSILIQLSKRIVDISYRHKLSHIGSCLTALPLIYDVYRKKKPEDKVVLSAGHAGLALYVVLEHFGYLKNAEEVLEKDGIHPVRDPSKGIEISTGSLGQGITIAAGLALANKNANVYVITTDGELAEGAFWEALYFKWKTNLSNLKIYLNDNGYTALDYSNVPYLALANLTVFEDCYEHILIPQFSWFSGLDQHYHVMNEEQYKEMMAFYDNL